MSKNEVSKLRAQLRAEKEERERLMLAVAEAAQREAQLQTLLERRRKENEELRKSSDFQRVRLNGFQLELQTRHYMLPFIAAQLAIILDDAKFTPAVEHILKSVQLTVNEIIKETNEQKPTLDPATWLVLARHLGLGTDFKQRRVPARREPAVRSTPPSTPTNPVEKEEAA